MAKYYIVSKSYNSIIYIESFLITFALTQGISDYFKYHWAYSIIVFFIILCLFLFAFFNFRILRYVITLFFSMTYGFFGYSLGRLIEEETFLSLAYHVSDFNLVKDSEDNNFED
jgi:hypothetical protein